MKIQKLALAMGLLALTGCPLFAPVQFEAQVVPFRQFVGPNALNNAGAVVGLVAPGFDPLQGGGVWQDGMFMALPAPEGEGANPVLINDNETVIGSFEVPAEPPLQVWQDGAVMELPAPANAPELALRRVFGINNRGDLAGEAENSGSGPPNLPVLFREDGTAEQLALFRRISFGGLRTFSTIPFAVNENLQVVGAAFPFDITDSGESHPVIWEDGEIERLPTPGERWGSASDINDSGWVVGMVRSTGGGFVPTTDLEFVVWVDGVMRTLRWRDGEPTDVIDINNRGDILTTYRIPVDTEGESPFSSKWSAVLWRWNPVIERHFPMEINGATDIPGAEQLSFRGRALNDAGQILVRVFNPGSEGSTLYLLTPDVSA